MGGKRFESLSGHGSVTAGQCSLRTLSEHREVYCTARQTEIKTVIDCFA